MKKKCEYLVIGSGLAGLSFALKMADSAQVTILSKVEANRSNTYRAQGGIAAAIGEQDSVDQHINDTLQAGVGLCKKNVVHDFLQQGPKRIQDLVDWGVNFDSDLTIEAAHSQRRVLHVKDHTGKSIQNALLEKIQEHPNIELIENAIAIDLITNKKANPNEVGPNKCIGAYVFINNKVVTFQAKGVVIATGGVGKIYLYTSNWDGATGDGLAMAYRAGARVANLEFMQFHPTCLYNPEARNFLISEAVRGEGGELVDDHGVSFMKKYHAKGSLAPRDVVAQAIDNEMKKSGADCVYIDITHKSKVELMERFPMIYERCKSHGIEIDKTPIPVVPAAHYLCGGILVNKIGQTDIKNLFAVGETAFSGLHGANRLASNSLLECMALSHNLSEYIKAHESEFNFSETEGKDWVYSHKHDDDEMVVISHMWDEIRRLMWNYVGIVRSDKRLERAEKRLENILKEIHEYYWNFKLHSDVLELRNLALVASLTVKCARRRRESRGIHFNINCPETAPTAKNTIV